MLTHRNLVYASISMPRRSGSPTSRSRSVCYLPLCHVAERCYSEVMQLVLGGTVSFAESIDTVALNIREIAPTFFVGVPRIYEKLQQNFLFRLGESGQLRQRLREGLFRLGPQTVGPAADRHATPGSTASAYALLYILLFRNIQRHLGLRPQPSPPLRRRLDLAGDAALLRHHRPPGVAGLWTDRKRRRRLHPDRQPSPARRLRPAAAPHRMEARQRRRDPAAQSRRLQRLFPRRKGFDRHARCRAAGCAPATSSRSWTMARSPWSTARRRSSSPPAARTSRLPRSRTR